MSATPKFSSTFVCFIFFRLFFIFFGGVCVEWAIFKLAAMMVRAALEPVPAALTILPFKLTETIRLNWMCTVCTQEIIPYRKMVAPAQRWNEKAAMDSHNWPGEWHIYIYLFQSSHQFSEKGIKTRSHAILEYIEMATLKQKNVCIYSKINFSSRATIRSPFAVCLCMGFPLNKESFAHLHFVCWICIASSHK